MRVGMVRPHTLVEGPGARFALWVQGCPIQCDGCFNPHLFSFDGGQDISVEQLCDELQQSTQQFPDLEGLTLLGGEPFSHAEDCYALAMFARALGLSVITFTGYTLKALQRMSRPHWDELISVTDVLVAGPFLKDKVDRTRPWLGSTNQEYHFLSPRYTMADFQQPDGVEVAINPDGSVSINGWAEDREFETLLANVRRQAGSDL